MENTEELKNLQPPETLSKLYVTNGLVREVTNKAKQIWEDEKMEHYNSHLQILKNGNSGHKSNTNGENTIIIGLRYEMKNYEKLKELDLFDSDFMTLIIFSLYHEVGHIKDKKRNSLNESLNALRKEYREKVLQKQLKEAKVLADLVWEKALKIEMNAWKYAKKFVNKKQKNDFNHYMEYSIQAHNQRWYSEVNQFIEE